MVVNSGNTIYDSRNNCNAIIETASNTLIAGCKNTVIPNSVTSIGSSAFQGCSGLTSVTIPNSVSSIGDYAFNGCTGLASAYNSHIFAYLNPRYEGAYTIPTGIEAIVGAAFYGCTGLTSITIPESVTSIGRSAFQSCTGLTSIEIPNSVTEIRVEAFYGCSGLTSVTIPNSVTSIDSYAFYGCTGLTSVTIPESVTSIGNGAFENCSGLTSVTIPNSVTEIGGYTFYNCSGLTSVTIPNSVTEIGFVAFYGCSSLTSVTIPNSVTSIGSSAFRYCTGLTYVSIPNHVTSIGSSAFANCTGLTSIDIKNNVIGEGMFQGCTGLNSIFIPNNVTSIGDSSFKDCTGLTSVAIGNGVTSIGSSAFEGCTGLTKADFASIESLFSITFGNSTANPLYYAHHLYINGKEITNLIIPENVTSIDDRLKECISFSSITIPENVTSIGEGAFDGCTGLAIITINSNAIASNSSPDIFGTQVKTYVFGNEVESIGTNFARNNTNLRSVTIGTGVLSIGDKAFSTPTKVIWLTNTPPSGYNNASGKVNYVANDLYTSLSNKKVYPYLSSLFEVGGIKYVPVSPSERTCDIIDCNYDNSAEHVNIGKAVSYRGVEMKVKEMNPYSCYDNTSIKNVRLGFEGNIGEYAFYSCTGLQTVNISNQGNIYNSAFENSNIKQTLTINAVGDIAPSAFAGISGFFTATVNNTGTVGASAFKGSSGLTSLEVASNVTDLGSEAFSGCSELTNATLQNKGKVDNNSFKGCSKLNVATLGNGITSIGEYAFDGCSSLPTINIPNSVTSIGASAFQKCSQLASVVMGTGVESSGSSAFNGCSALTNVQIGKNVGTIDTYAFNGCSALPSIRIPMSVNSIGDYSFQGCTALAEVIMEEVVGEKRSESIVNWHNYVATGGTSGVNAAEDYPKLLDGATNTKWCVTNVNGPIYVEFDATCLIIPVGYILTTGNDTKSAPGRNPKSWVIKGKNNPGDGWTTLTTVENGEMPTGNYESKTYMFSSDIAYRYYRYEVQSVVRGREFQLSELCFLVKESNSSLSLGSNGGSPLFADCPLDTVYIGQNITYPTSSNKGYSPFYRNTSLRSIHITNKETEISANEFYGCENLKNVRLGDGITTIGDWAFSGCSSIEYFLFGKSTKEIGKETFSDCTAMTKLISRAANPPTCGDQALDDINKWNCTLEVPFGSLTAYQAAPQWKEFFFMEEGTTGVNDVNVNDDAEHNRRKKAIYDLNGRCQPKIQKGLNIIKYADGSVKRISGK